MDNIYNELRMQKISEIEYRFIKEFKNEKEWVREKKSDKKKRILIKNK